jgi:NAD(P)-dependent dehydrogenase (short-subunit alcohol dehydrogenase family)
MPFNFRNKIVLVTGASRGIGAQLAKEYLESGAQLILTAAQPSSLKRLQQKYKHKGSKVHCCRLDFTDTACVETFLELLAEYSRIDVCVNNAGINEIDDIEHTKLEAWDSIMKVNLKGPFILTRALAAKMKKNKYGRIVNMSSIFGVVTRAKRSIYSSSKSGLLGLTRCSAIELASHNILVNAVSPGFVLTDLTRNILSKEEIRRLTGQIPIARMAQPSDISKTVLFLSSEHNTYIVGQNIIVDGGYVDV